MRVRTCARVLTLSFALSHAPNLQMVTELEEQQSDLLGAGNQTPLSDSRDGVMLRRPGGDILEKAHLDSRAGR